MQLSVIRQQQEAFRVIVKPAGRVDGGNSKPVGEGGADGAVRTAFLVGKLAKNPERFIEQNQRCHRGK